MNDINNFNNNQKGPDPINRNPPINKPIITPKKNSHQRMTWNFAIVMIGIFLIILSVSTVFDFISKIQGQGEIVTNEEKGNISVNASASVSATPDTAVISVGVETMDIAIASAVSENARKITNIENYAQGLGILPEDIKTTEFSIEPQYQKKTEGVDLNLYPEGQIVISNYKIREVLEVKVRDVNIVGDIIQSCLDAGANTVGDLTFIVEDTDSYATEAREEAIKKAEIEAAEIAKSLGVQLGTPTSYSDSSYSPSIRGGGYAMDSESISVSPGSNTITVNVYVVYSIK